MKLNYELSAIQKSVGNKVLLSYLNSKKILIWAVCGSGKTEVVLEVIDFCLKNNLNVGFAAPRVEIVKEIKLRFESIFEMDICCLYGGSKDVFGNFICLTTHQLLGFYDFFDVLIIDEIDAFPFKGNLELENHPKFALKKHGLQVNLSATPDKFDISSSDDVFLIPNRYHGYLLDVPKVVFCKYSKKMFKYQLPKKILKHLMNVEKQVIVFIPTISQLKKVSYILNDKGVVHEIIHSKVESKDDVLKSFRNNDFRILLSTSILERGVTFVDIDVVVLDASNDLFLESTLVQICGRVGRKLEAPTGNIYFYTDQITKSIILCKKNIKKMNKLAKKILKSRI